VGDICKPHIQQGAGIHKELLKLNSKKNPNRTQAKITNSHLTEGDMQMVFEHVKKRSNSLGIREMQMKTTMHVTLHTYQDN